MHKVRLPQEYVIEIEQEVAPVPCKGNDDRIVVSVLYIFVPDDRHLHLPPRDRRVVQYVCKLRILLAESEICARLDPDGVRKNRKVRGSVGGRGRLDDFLLDVIRRGREDAVVHIVGVVVPVPLVVLNVALLRCPDIEEAIGNKPAVEQPPELRPLIAGESPRVKKHRKHRRADI